MRRSFSGVRASVVQLRLSRFRVGKKRQQRSCKFFRRARLLKKLGIDVPAKNEICEHDARHAYEEPQRRDQFVDLIGNDARCSGQRQFERDGA